MNINEIIKTFIAKTQFIIPIKEKLTVSFQNK